MNKPIIAIIRTEPLNVVSNGVDHTYPSAEYEVVEIISHKNGKIYVTNQWYKEGVPQLIHGAMVAEVYPQF